MDETQEIVEPAIDESTQEQEVAEVEGDSTTPKPDDTAKPAAEPKKDGVQKRIDRAVANQRQAERNAEYWRGQAEARQALPPAKPTEVDARPPVEEDFESTADYLNAAAEHAASKKFAELEKRATQERMAQARKEETSQQFAVFDRRMEAYRKENPDFDVEAVGLLRISESVGRVMILSEKGPGIADYLVQNPDEADRISRLSNPIEAAKEIGKIEAKLDLPAIRRTTKAPPPHKPLGSRGSGQPEDDSDRSTWSNDRWDEWDAKQEAKRRGG